MAASWEHWHTQVGFPSPAQWVKDPVLLQLRLGWQLWLGSDPWPGELHIPRGGPKKKKRITKGGQAPVDRAWAPALLPVTHSLTHVPTCHNCPTARPVSSFWEFGRPSPNSPSHPHISSPQTRGPFQTEPIKGQQHPCLVPGPLTPPHPLT